MSRILEVTVGLEPTFAALQAAASSASASPPNLYALVFSQKTENPPASNSGGGSQSLEAERKLVGQPPRARRNTRATWTAAAHRVQLGVETHQKVHTRLLCYPQASKRENESRSSSVDLRLRSDCPSCPFISAGE